MVLERVGPYRLLEILGRGGMGTVYRAIDAASNVVALKRLDGAASSQAAMDRFLREARVRIDHPNVIRTLGAGMDAAGQPYLVLELLSGRTLDAEIARGIEVADLVRIAVQACRGLDAIHRAGFVHRDVKPANLFCDIHGGVKVLDFGVAAVMEGAGGLTRSGAVIGTPAYLSPEQARGEPGVDARADLFALGVVLHEALAQKSPFERDGTLATLLAVALAPAPPLRHVPPELAAIVARCLEKPKERRFQSAAALAEALSAADLRLPDSSRPDESLAERIEASSTEQRSVALVLADGLIDTARFEHAMRAAGGEAISLLGRRAAGLFGAHRSHGDEIDRALSAARAAEGAAARIAIAVGQASLSGELLSGVALREAEEAAGRAETGLVTGPVTVRALVSRCELTELEPGLFEIGAGRAQPAVRPLVGREPELALLRRARDVVVDESRMVATWIVGPAGIGKSRLADCVQALAAETLTSHRTARALPGDERSLTLIARALASETRPLWRTPTRGIDAQALGDWLRAELRERLGRLLAEGPLILVLDDLQWADPASLSWIEELPHLVGDAPLWLVLCAREELLERRPELAEAIEPSSRLEPSPLRAQDVVELAAVRLGRAPPLATARALAAHTGGNPLFVEQLLDVLDPGGLDDVLVDEWPLPPTIEHAVQARLDQLPADEKECAKHLAVFERPALASEVDALLGRSTEPLLSSLARRGLLARVVVDGARSYRFRSPVVADVAYALLGPDRQRDIHRLAADVTVAHGRTQEEIARHLDRAGEPSRAGPLYADAALEAARRGDSPAVLRCAARSIECGLPSSHRFAVHFARSEAARFAADSALQEAAIEDARAAAADDRERGLAASERGEWLRRNRRLDEALSQLTNAVALARASEDDETLARAVARRASALVTLGRAEEASRALSALGPSLNERSPATRAIVEEVHAYAASSVGDHGARRAAYARAAALYAEAGDLRRSAGAESNRADADNRLGLHAEAQSALHRALALARKVGNRLTEGYALVNLGYSFTASSQRPEALLALAQARRIARALDEPHLELAARLYTARAELGGSVDPPWIEALERLVGDARGDPTLEANARALLARARLGLGDARGACESALAALALRDAHGAVEEGEGELYLVAAEALEAAGRGPEAREVRERGRRRVREMADRIADPEERRSFLERVPEHRALCAEPA